MLRIRNSFFPHLFCVVYLESFRFVVLRARSSLSFASCIFVLVFGAVSNINHIAWAGNTWARGQFVGFRQDEASLGLAKTNGDNFSEKEHRSTRASADAPSGLTALIDLTR